MALSGRSGSLAEVGHSEGVRREPELWPDPAEIVRKSVSLDFAVDAGSVAVLGTAWPTPVGLPVMTGGYRGRLLLVGAENSALFSTDFTRRHLVERLWSGPTSSLRWRRLRSWLLRVETPDGRKFYADVTWERRKLDELAP